MSYEHKAKVSAAPMNIKTDGHPAKLQSNILQLPLQSTAYGRSRSSPPESYSSLTFISEQDL